MDSSDAVLRGALMFSVRVALFALLAAIFAFAPMACPGARAQRAGAPDAGVVRTPPASDQSSRIDLDLARPAT
ncbi:hypothetical protein L6R52_39405, partial [Myxococcota bacterium]|nr:hypothetical protein [Myxococcota bacterium]